MQEKINTFNAELNAINIVLDKLLTKQNSSVYDKLCIKCNNLLNNISLVIPNIKTSEERNQLITILRCLRDSASKLSIYREYLIAAINSKIETLENKEVITYDNNKKLILENKNRKEAA